MPEILVVGGASGIGLATSRRVAKWANVTNADLSYSPLVESHDILIDLRSADEIKILVDRLPETLNGIVYSAGLPGTREPAEVLWVNVLAFLRLCEMTSSRLAAGASIVLLGSISSSRHDIPHSQLRQMLSITSITELEAWTKDHLATAKDSYTLSKFLIDEITTELSAELRERQVRVNAVKPGPVETDLLPEFRETIGSNVIERARQVLGRHADPDEIAAVIEFLLKPSSRWINGTQIRVDGGLLAGLRSGRAQTTRHLLDLA